jgi:hypothetical protein
MESITTSKTKRPSGKALAGCFIAAFMWEGLTSGQVVNIVTIVVLGLVLVVTAMVGESIGREAPVRDAKDEK